MTKEYNVNDQIDAQIINLILPDGKMQESIKISKALKIGEEAGLDVVEVSLDGKGGLPTCKILDYGKFLYKQNKKSKKQVQHVKEIKYGFTISQHDLEVKHKHIAKFLSKKYVVKYIMELTGRQKDMAKEALGIYNENISSFKEMATWKDPQISYGRRIIISTTLMPL